MYGNPYSSKYNRCAKFPTVSRVVEKMGYLPLDLLVLIRLTDPRFFFTGSDPGQVSSFLSLFSMTNDSWIIFVFTERQKHETFNYLEEKTSFASE